MRRNSTLVYSLNNMKPAENFLFKTEDIFGDEWTAISKMLNEYEEMVSDNAVQKVMNYAKHLTAK